MKSMVVAYPVLSQSNWDTIQKYRKKFDRNFLFIGPHFTIVFSSETPSESLAKILDSINFKPIQFTILEAVPHYDVINNLWNVFLCPQDGKEIMDMHQNIYDTYQLSQTFPNLPFIPHITIGHVESKNDANRITDEINGEINSISGLINELSVVEICADNSCKTMHQKKLLSQTPAVAGETFKSRFSLTFDLDS